MQLAYLCRYVDSIYERAAVLDTDPPPTAMIFVEELVEQWFEDARRSKETASEG